MLVLPFVLGLGKGNRVKDHYRAHKLSLWLNLIPKLNQPYQAKEPLEENIHLLVNHNDLTSYDGIVRETSKLSTLHSNKNKGSNYLTSSSSSSRGHLANGTFIVGGDEVKLPESDPMMKKTLLPQSKVTHSESSVEAQLDKTNLQARSEDGSKLIDEDSSFLKRSTDISPTNDSKGSSISNSSNVYTTALSVTIVFGVSFLVLNIILLLRELGKKDGRRNNQRKRSGTRLPNSSQDASPSCSQVCLFLFFYSFSFSSFPSQSSIDY